MLPAFVTIALVDPADTSRVLVISQVVLSFGIPFALYPLVHFTSRREIMGNLVNNRVTTAVAVVIAALISSLNVFLLGKTFGGLFS
jgi:manganese transport protein